jgi:hypothetical protein
MSIIPALRKQRLEDCKYKVGPGYIELSRPARPYLK